MSETRTLFRVEGDESGKVNSKVAYTLYAENEAGKLKDVNISELNAFLRGSSGHNVRGRIGRSSVGTYSVEFILALPPGNYDLDVTMSGRPIFRKGDIQLQVTPENARSSSTLKFNLDGAGLFGGRVGHSTEFVIDVLDEYGQLVEVDPSALQVHLEGPEGLDADVHSIRSGKYRASYLVNHAGSYTLGIFYDGRSIMEEKTVNFSDSTDASRSIVRNVPGQVRANQEFQFTILSSDGYGSQVTVGGDSWTAIASGPERVNRLNITDNDDGSYTVSTVLPVPGNYSFEIRLEGVAAQNSPVKIKAV